MNDSTDRQLAPIAELRLRQWAHRNYVPADVRRDDEWHPVVLDEMRRCDAQQGLTDLFGAVPRFDIVTSSGIVPLEPSRHDGGRVDGAHEGVSAPQFTQQGSRQTESKTGEPSIPYYA